MDRLQAGYVDLQALDVEKILPGLQQPFSELDARFKNAQSLFAGQLSLYDCNSIQFTYSDENFSELDHFQRAAIQLAINELEKLDSLSRVMLECVREIKGDAKQNRVFRSLSGINPYALHSDCQFWIQTGSE